MTDSRRSAGPVGACACITPNHYHHNASPSSDVHKEYVTKEFAFNLRDINSLHRDSFQRIQERLSRGLDKGTIASLPCLRYSLIKRWKQEKAPTECSVCLTEFGENEKIRLLPSCGHGFHLDCIDMWLFSHSNCPMCRRSVLPLSNASHIFEMDIEAGVSESSQSRSIGRSSHFSPVESCQLSTVINDGLASDAADEPNNNTREMLVLGSSDRALRKESSLVLSRDMEPGWTLANQIEARNGILGQPYAATTQEKRRACKGGALRRSYSVGFSQQKALSGKKRGYINLNTINRLYRSKSCSIFMAYVNLAPI
ncbi:hypothetical protein O6H91_19G062800 [Diphasiastrum complanatum]|uniref:Uncharacterized protein n=1 Tax=Diphasiastrum complanatum TaxID=34168 RepID=A0ACC2AWR5_DIPCM|nr:hypothetical protein O6H91_19G062800 [Diphasiastrum complanatum]